MSRTMCVEGKVHEGRAEVEGMWKGYGRDTGVVCFSFFFFFSAFIWPGVKLLKKGLGCTVPCVL